MQKGAAELRVFVSSTFIDLEEYRKAVCDILRQAGAIDVAMEHIGARDERPKEECLRLVKESDAFIGIYAHRYGTIPTGELKSITQMEYEEAVAARKRCLIYIIDENIPWQPKYVDIGQGAELLASFKKRIRENHIVKSFTNKDQLSAAVVADLVHYFPITPELVEKWRVEQKIAVSKEFSNIGKIDKDSFENVPSISIKIIRDNRTNGFCQGIIIPVNQFQSVQSEVNSFQIGAFNQWTFLLHQIQYLIENIPVIRDISLNQFRLSI